MYLFLGALLLRHCSVSADGVIYLLFIYLLLLLKKKLFTFLFASPLDVISVPNFSMSLQV